MKLVVDANVVFSALIAGHLTDVILSPRLELVAPDLLFTEIMHNQEDVRAKSRLSAADFQILLALLEKKIQSVPAEEFLDRFGEAEELLPTHKKDAPYVALALKLNCPFWTYEKRFAGKVEVVTTAEVRKSLS